MAISVSMVPVGTTTISVGRVGATSLTWTTATTCATPTASSSPARGKGWSSLSRPAIRATPPGILNSTIRHSPILNNWAFRKSGVSERITVLLIRCAKAATGCIKFLIPDRGPSGSQLAVGRLSAAFFWSLMPQLARQCGWPGEIAFGWPGKISFGPRGHATSGKAGDDFSYGHFGGLIIELCFDEGGQGVELAGSGFFSGEQAIGNLLYSVCGWRRDRSRRSRQASE